MADPYSILELSGGCEVAWDYCLENDIIMPGDVPLQYWMQGIDSVSGLSIENEDNELYPMSSSAFSMTMSDMSSYTGTSHTSASSSCLMNGQSRSSHGTRSIRHR